MDIQVETDNCPWRNSNLCPQPSHGSSTQKPVLLIRIDSTVENAFVCACSRPARQGAENGPSLAPTPLDPAHPVGHSIDPLGSRRDDFARALRTLLKDPEQGMAAAALASLPQDVMEHLLLAVDDRRPVVLRVNHGEASGPDQAMAILGLRALAKGLGFTLEVRESVDLPSRDSSSGDTPTHDDARA